MAKSSGESEHPPIVQDVMAYCSGCQAIVWQRMVAYVDEITIRCKRNPKHFVRYLPTDALPDWMKPYIQPGRDQGDDPWDRR